MTISPVFSPTACSSPLKAASGTEQYTFGVNAANTAQELRRFADLLDHGNILLSSVAQAEAANASDFLTHTITITYCTKSLIGAP